MCNLSCARWYKGTAELLCLTELKWHVFLVLFHWLKSLTYEGVEETGVPGDNRQGQASEKSHIIKPDQDLNPRSSICGRCLLGKQMS